MLKGNAESYVKLKGSLSIPEAIQGKSAYEIAVMNGFDGTEEEWLMSLNAVKSVQSQIKNNILVVSQKEG